MFVSFIYHSMALFTPTERCCHVKWLQTLCVVIMHLSQHDLRWSLYLPWLERRKKCGAYSKSWAKIIFWHCLILFLCNILVLFCWDRLHRKVHQLILKKLPSKSTRACPKAVKLKFQGDFKRVRFLNFSSFAVAGHAQRRFGGRKGKREPPLPQHRRPRQKSMPREYPTKINGRETTPAPKGKGQLSQ